MWIISIWIKRSRRKIPSLSECSYFLRNCLIASAMFFAALSSLLLDSSKHQEDIKSIATIISNSYIIYFSVFSFFIKYEQNAQKVSNLGAINTNLVRFAEFENKK